ncbi:hypothetical protein GSN00_01890 [Cylindrospermopsis raciborskii CHAB3438]|uniref:hypothetical protein n=2 Tax=Cylindrospermopsis raciborskii TaxID=77022 RepID=UPI001F0F455F|nr:hypothetical protein [Cylindrospermopsis raciborskii]MCH4903165.1 hypothetical protein [Cylindrospermopsis raciborskii CHAB3438]
MNKVYSTWELIQILSAERQACLKGERLKLDVKVSGNPIIDQFIPTEGLQKFTAYQDFKYSIHQYQREHQVSGIVWKDLTINAQTLHYPEVHGQLIALDTDLQILKRAKKSMLTYWEQVTANMDLYLSMSNGREHEKIHNLDVERIAQRTEWVSFLKWENGSFLELILQMGWGRPEEAAYKRGRPHSGSEFIHAVKPGNYPIG